LLPTNMAEANWRMFLPFAGLALAVTRAAWILFGERAQSGGRGVAPLAAASALGALVLAGCTWGAHERNRIWYSEDTLWGDVVSRSPANARALLKYGEALILDRDFAGANDYLRRAAEGARTPALKTDIGMAYDRLANDPQAEKQFQLAIAAIPAYGRAWSMYSQWLMARQRSKEAFKIATRAVAIEPGDSTAHQTLMDFYSQQFDWGNLQRVASDGLQYDPDDPAAQHSSTLARAAVDEVTKVEAKAKIAPTPDEYLKLSVMYFKNKRYEDCVNTARSALKINPSLGEAWANIAAAYHAMGKNDDAIAALREVIRLRPDLTFAASDLQYLLNEKAAGRN
ncbi:MAG: tetratricopeptide repeat protein, partial [Acidobacteriota bacterium]|nr:tetratricopeptide repeat protein [Acidobacteriota bacterium]